jgi:hypothetical protein
MLKYDLLSVTESKQLYSEITSSSKDNDISNKTKNRREKIMIRKMKNKIDDLQWKTIKHLTEHYNNILLGDMSAKGICINNVLSGQTKQAVMIMKHYQFKQRLEYKCNAI